MIKHSKYIAILISIMVAVQPLSVYAEECYEINNDTEDIASDITEDPTEESEDTTEELEVDSEDNGGVGESGADVVSDNSTDNTDDNETASAEEIAEEKEEQNISRTPQRIRALGNLRSSSLPSSYDARDEGIVTPARSQIGGTCYLYAGVALAETSLLICNDHCQGAA